MRPFSLIAATLSLIVLVSDGPLAQRGPDVNPRKPSYARLGSRLSDVADHALRSGDAAAAQAFARTNPLVRNQRIPVTIRTTSAAAVTAFLRSRGHQPANESAGVLEAYVTPGLLRALALHPAVRSVREVVPPRPSVVSEGVALHNADTWQAEGYGGSGVKVGVIDVGFIRFASLMGSELPGSVTRRCYSAVGVFSTNLAHCETRTIHGTGVAEALIDVAPDVQLFIANPTSTLDFQSTIAWMASQGVRVINFSAGWVWDGPGDGTSPYSDSPLASVVDAVNAGITFVAAAGNQEGATWFGAYEDADADSWHEFGTAELNHVTLPASGTASFQMRWQDSWGSASRDIDLYLLDSALNIVAGSEDVQDGTAGSVPREFLAYTSSAGGTYYLAVRRYSGAEPAWVQVQSFSSNPLGESTVGYSVVNPAESHQAGVLAVGAAAWSTSSTIEYFSSRGPTPDGRIKPDIVGADRGSSFTYAPQIFAGTSQASPHVAGLAALVIQAFPAYTPAQVSSYLMSNALPRGASPNHTWGAGLAFLPDLLSAPPFGTFSTPADGSTVAGEVPLTGWALDDEGVTAVKVYRNPMTGEPTQSNGHVLIGSAAFVPGARPDVQAAYPGYPSNDRAGWGLMVLSNMLPGQGNGVFTFYAYAEDADGQAVLLGTRSVTAANAASVKPFGTIDTPAQGATVSGTVVNFGWALTPLPNAIPTDGTTIRVHIDGVFVGNPTYDNYRADIATAFPGLNNSDGAVGFHVIDTAALANGLHTISWVVRDDAGNAQGVGSRYFTVENP